MMSSIFLQFGGAQGTNMLFMLAMIAVLVFFMIIPQRKKAKAQANFMEELKKGKKVVTSSGILGTVDKIDDKFVTLNVGNKTYLQVTKNAISQELTDAIYTKEVD